MNNLITYPSIMTLIISSTICAKTLTQANSESRYSTEKIVAVSIEEIKKYGITTKGEKFCDSTSNIDIFTTPDLANKFGTIASLKFVKYDRLSEILHVPYWASTPKYRLFNGEKFKISTDDLSGWIGEHNLLTFSSLWRDRNPERFLKVYGNTAICIYSSGQYETAECSAVTVWEREFPECTWNLKILKFQPVKIWLYTFPQIDTLYVDNDKKLKILLSTIGGDADEIWGSYSLYSFKDEQLMVDSTWDIGSNKR
jgi:hypothetical protein